ncbi:MAG TPA: hypothetical protein VMR97_09285 [Acidimicrobiales bacterium]|nr:hypothetical protein [Acidimicrobiales bacterium]
MADRHLAREHEDTAGSGGGVGTSHTQLEALELAMTGSDGTTGDVGGPSPAQRTALGLAEQARLVGAYEWVEQRLFEVLGSWVGTEVSEPARVLFDLHSQQHAWHAELFAERLPVLSGVDRDSLCAAPGPELETALELVGAAGGTLLRVGGVGRLVLPRLVATYGLHLQRAVQVADAPLARALRLVLRDEIEAWRSTELMVEGLIRSEKDVADVAGHLRALEEPLIWAGPGLVPWP